ncbi:alpha/beta hydrolase [Chromobacterium haemolyticum]|uniref:Alpha/beta hydrolase n=1 Tax=Chromobacterium fluminis TaxID=3044269 RepID=A0ABX0L4B5_9NEIS|nr:gamma-mobile-trio protein GmtX [Chromobacterium haemolyticum]NHR04482.1 alpha/beta hydrolase [Chromobacterium haemolyticum]
MTTPEVLLEQLKAKSNARKQRSLQVIDDICREQRERGSDDFTIATIGKLSELRSGPAHQAIRNKSGEDYRALIAAWAQHVGVPTKKPATGRVSRSCDDALLKGISDPVIRAEVGFLLAENRKLKGQIRLLQQASQHPIVIDQRTSAGISPPVEVIMGVDLTELECEAFEHAISPACLDENGWKIDQRGAVYDAVSDRRIFKNGFATGVRKVLAQAKRK